MPVLSTRKANISLLTCSPNFLHTALGKQQRNRYHKTATNQQHQGMQSHKQPTEQPGSSELGDSQHSATASPGISEPELPQYKTLGGAWILPAVLLQISAVVAALLHISIHPLTPHKTPPGKKSHSLNRSHILKPESHILKPECG